MMNPHVPIIQANPSKMYIFISTVLSGVNAING